MAFTLLIPLVAALHIAPAAAGMDALPAGLEAGERAAVVEVIDGDTVLLDDGWQVRLVGIQAPKLPLGRKNFSKWPLADEAKAVLESMVLGRHVRLAYGGLPVDRHGRRLAHLFMDDGTWIQREMLLRGLARVYSFPDNRAVVSQMLAAERQARTRGAGIWANSWYAIRTPEQAGRDIGSFQIIEGRVLDAADVRGTIYLNFGQDWRSDFTVKVSKRDLATFDADGLDLLSLKGRKVRVRGWLDSRNGPIIEVTHPEQIEVLEN